MAQTNEPGYTPPDITLMGEEHIRRYRETDGDVGYLWNGATILLLTTTGRKSGEQRTSALIFAYDGDDMLLIASQGGAPTHPAWYHNLTAKPQVEVQVKGNTMAATARTAEGAEKERLWKVMTEQWPNYDVYTTRTTRDIPLVVITPS
jgi:deazaflavin-dependent oxidoreductase (nitroreductase family)